MLDDARGLRYVVLYAVNSAPARMGDGRGCIREHGVAWLIHIRPHEVPNPNPRILR